MNMEQKIVKITISGARAEFSIETRDQRGRLHSDPGMSGGRNSTNDQALAHVIDKFGKNPSYTIFVNGTLINKLPGKSSESLGDRFLRWLDQYDRQLKSQKIG